MNRKLIALSNEILFDDCSMFEYIQCLTRLNEQQESITDGTLLSINTIREEHVRPDKYFEDWLPRYIDLDFYRLFRMTKTTFSKLMLEIMPLISVKEYHGGNMPVHPEKGVLVTLWYLAKGETFRTIGDKFNISDSTVLSVTECHINILANDLLKKFIIWPKEEECVKISEDFAMINNYPGVIGAIDGCHINCKVPEEQHISYLNRKQQHSIVLQAICTANFIFTNVYIGFPGSAHDARVLQNSSLFKDIESHGPEKYFYGTYHLLGDSAYFLRTWLITPYIDTGHLTREEKKHNYLHSSTRVVIENGFSRLKGRWRILNYVNVYSIEKVIKIVAAACTLHNFTYLMHDTWPENDTEEQGNWDHVLQNRDAQYRRGHAKREEIKAYLQNV